MAVQFTRSAKKPLSFECSLGSKTENKLLTEFFRALYNFDTLSLAAIMVVGTMRGNLGQGYFAITIFILRNEDQAENEENRLF